MPAMPGMPPAAPPVGATPAPAPSAAPPGAPMGAPALAGLARAPVNAMQGIIPPQLQALMLFLAGMGLPVLSQTLERMKPKPPGGGKGQLGKEAAANPQMTNSLQAQMIAKLAAARGAGASPAPGLPSAAPAANPLAMFAGR